MANRNTAGSLFVALALLILQVGCGGSAAAANTTPPPPPAIAVSVSASAAALGTDGTSTLTATVSNDTSGAGVSWSVPSGAPGTLTTTDSLHAKYAAGIVGQAGSVVVTATSKADTSKTASVTLQLAPASVSINASASTLGSGGSSTLSATVANDSSGAGVTWSVPSGSPGTLSTTDTFHATYTAGTVSQPGSVVVTATSIADPTRTFSVTIELVATLTVSINASSLSLGTDETSTLTATVSNDSSNAGVTWSVPNGAPGTLTPSDVFHATYAAGIVSQVGSVVVTATSNADATKTATVTIALELPVSVTPRTADLGIGQTLALTAAVLHDQNGQGVSWSLPQGAAAGTLSGQTTSAATYTAPASISQQSTVTVTATSIADANKTGTATLTLHPLSVTMGTPTAASTGPLQTSRVSATAFDPNGVTWTASSGTIVGLDSGCSSGTSCCPSGQCQAVYEAPQDISGSGQAIITATSNSDGTKKATATITLTAGASWEDLVAFFNDHSQRIVKPYADLERGAGSYQPDRMIFHEVGLDGNGRPLDTEIWRMDNDSPPVSANPAASPSPSWVIAGTLNRTPWNSNGSYFALGASPCVPEVHCSDAAHGDGADSHNFLYSAAGDSVRLINPVDPDPARGGGFRANQLGLASGGYLPWDRFNPDLLYLVSWGDTLYLDGKSRSYLFSVDISKNFQMNHIVELPDQADGQPNASYVDSNGNSQPIKRALQSYLAEDNTAMVTDVNPPFVPDGTQPQYIPRIYMVNMNPKDATHDGQIVAQYFINFPNLSTPGLAVCPAAVLCGNFVAGTVEGTGSQYHFHDIYFQRDAANHFLFNYGPLGSVGDGVFWQASEDGSSVVQAFPDAFGLPLGGTPYMSHPALNFDGTAVAYAGFDTAADEDTGTEQGAGNWVRTFGPDNRLNDGAVAGNVVNKVDNVKGGVGHEGWDGYDRKYLVFDGFTTSADPVTGLAEWSEITGDPTSTTPSFRVLVDDGMRDPVNGPGIVNGPAQSPDATKMMFSLPQNWNDTQEAFSVYLAVDHRPFPPVLSATQNAGAVNLTWAPDPNHPHREVAGYHVYRSTDGVNFSEVTSPGVNTAAFGSINALTLSDTPTGGATTVYYAVTAQEYSGLESSQLSNVVQVVLGGAINATFAAAGTTGWDTAAPDPPSQLSVCRMSGGEYKLTWNPSDSANVRYYNIYYDGGAAVPAFNSWQDAQHYLIDSPAATETSYIFWQASPNDVPLFGIVAVDRQDLPSKLVTAAAGLNPPACQ